jgi:adenosylcobinamide amidohydrolase
VRSISTFLDIDGWRVLNTQKDPEQTPFVTGATEQQRAAAKAAYEALRKALEASK